MIKIILKLIFYAAPLLASEFDSVLEKAFPDYSENEISLSLLKGGLSGIALYKISVGEKEYVLRWHNGSSLTDQDRIEHFALIEASKLHLSPEVIYVSDDHRALIMEFIEGNTLSISLAKAPWNCSLLGKAVRKAHEIKGHPCEGEGLLSKAERCTEKVLRDGHASSHEILDALNLIKKYRERLQTYVFKEVYVHGDLNPRNIFLNGEDVKLIDWAETHLEDPFYDLSYLALKLDYTPLEESILLNSYLGRQVNKKELERFNLQKKIHQAFWSLTNLYLADVELKKHPDQKIAPKPVLKEWGEYQRAFAEGQELDAQYFYELSRLNYHLAKE